MTNMGDYKFYENKLISKIDRFKLQNQEINELKKNFRDSNILLIGAAGSIGKELVKKIVEFNFAKFYLVDKNENELVELNRFLLYNKKLIKKIEYICSDFYSLNLSNFLKQHKISHLLNLAAVKHVRSEENINSIKYMLNTNCVECLNFKPNKELKKVFVISTDKASDPSSIMGLTKKIMEHILLKKSLMNKSVDFSTIRFGNVSFSNGSILKLIIDRINQKKSFGIPINIKRYFITHQESTSLCLRALLKKNSNKVLIPKANKIGKQKDIYELLLKILKIFNIKIKTKANVIKSKYFNVQLVKSKIRGQKNYEKFVGNKEIIVNLENDHILDCLEPQKKFNYSKVLEILKNSKSIDVIIKKTLNTNKLGKKISQII
jgi:FlaA1/EpsC-like NDP-sugar epimerase